MRTSIQSVNTENDAGITVGTDSLDGNAITVLISGETKGSTYEVSIEATTAAGEVYEKRSR